MSPLPLPPLAPSAASAHVPRPRSTLGTAAVAVQLVARYYTRRSMRAHKPEHVAIAALFAAWKIENREHRCALPKLRKLADEGMKQWHYEGRSWDARAAPQVADPALRAHLLDETYLESLDGAICRAESELLSALGFDLRVDLPQEQLGPAGLVALAPALASTLRVLHAQETFVTACHRVAKHDPRLCLQFSAQAIALALCHFIFSRYDPRWSWPGAPVVPPPGPDGSPWYVAAGLPDADWLEIHSRLCAKVYPARRVTRAAPAPRG